MKKPTKKKTRSVDDYRYTDWSVKKTPKEWMRTDRCDFVVTDPDGWRNEHVEWLQPITWAEFMRLSKTSTIVRKKSPDGKETRGLFDTARAKRTAFRIVAELIEDWVEWNAQDDNEKVTATLHVVARRFRHNSRPSRSRKA